MPFARTVLAVALGCILAVVLCISAYVAVSQAYYHSPGQTAKRAAYEAESAREVEAFRRRVAGW